jgi:hypothetical protein
MQLIVNRNILRQVFGNLKFRVSDGLQSVERQLNERIDRGVFLLL